MVNLIVPFLCSYMKFFQFFFSFMFPVQTCRPVVQIERLHQNLMPFPHLILGRFIIKSASAGYPPRRFEYNGSDRTPCGSHGAVPCRLFRYNHSDGNRCPPNPGFMKCSASFRAASLLSCDSQALNVSIKSNLRKTASLLLFFLVLTILRYRSPQGCAGPRIPSVFVHHIDQNPHRQPSQFQYPYLYTLRA